MTDRSDDNEKRIAAAARFFDTHFPDQPLAARSGAGAPTSRRIRVCTSEGVYVKTPGSAKRDYT